MRVPDTARYPALQWNNLWCLWGSATRMETVDEAARSLQTETIRAEHFAELNIGRRETLGSLISGSPHGHGSTARRFVARRRVLAVVCQRFRIMTVRMPSDHRFSTAIPTKHAGKLDCAALRSYCRKHRSWRTRPD